MLTNRVPTTVVRGAGRPQAAFAMERLLDRVARELRDRPRRTAPPQHDRAGADALPASASFFATASRSSMRAAISRRARSAPWRWPIMTVFPPARRGPRARPLHRHRHRQLRGRHRPRPVRRRERAHPAKRQGRGRDRRRDARPGHRTRCCRRSWRTSLGCRIGDIVVTAGDTNAISQGVGAFASRQTVNAGSSAMMAGEAASGGRSSRSRRARSTSPRPISTSRTAVAVARAPATGRCSPSANWPGSRRACRDFRCRRAKRRASSTPPISPRRKPPTATAPMSPRSRSIR